MSTTEVSAPEWRDVSAIRAKLARRESFNAQLVTSWLDDSPAGGVAARLDDATAQREATPGRPEDGPYPVSVGEVADEVARWIDQTARTYAPGLAHQVVDALGVTVAGFEIPAQSPVVSRPSDTLLAVEIAARNLFRAICHEHDRGETFPVRVSVCMNALREALGEEYPADDSTPVADWSTS